MAAELDNLRTLLSLHEKTVHEHNEAREQMEQEHTQAVEALRAEHKEAFDSHLEKGEQTRQHLVKQKVVDGLRRQLLASTKDQVGYAFRLWKDQVRETALRELEAKLGDQEKELRNNAAQMDEQDGVIAGLEAEISGLKDQLDRAEAGLEQTKQEHAESMRAMVVAHEKTIDSHIEAHEQTKQKHAE